MQVDKDPGVRDYINMSKISSYQATFPMRGFVHPGDGGVLPAIFNDASYFTFLGTKGDFVFRISS